MRPGGCNRRLCLVQRHEKRVVVEPIRFARAERLDRGPFVRTPQRAFRHRPVAAVDDQHLVDAGCVERDGKQVRALSIGLDVERQHARRHAHLGWTQLGIVEESHQRLAQIHARTSEMPSGNVS